MNGRHTVPAYMELAEALRHQILSGELREGDRLPVEPELSTTYGVSRSTVREALRVLSSQYLVTTTRGVSGGSFVVHPNVSQLSGMLEAGLGLLAMSRGVSAADLLEARDLVEVPAAGLAAERADEEQLRELEETLLDPADGDLDAMQDCNRRFHSLLVAAAGNPMLDMVARPLFGVLGKRFARGEAPGQFWDDVVHDHRAILTAVRARDPEAARAQARAHLGRLRSMYDAIGARDDSDLDSVGLAHPPATNGTAGPRQPGSRTG